MGGWVDHAWRTYAGDLAVDPLASGTVERFSGTLESVCDTLVCADEPPHEIEEDERTHHAHPGERRLRDQEAVEQGHDGETPKQDERDHAAIGGHTGTVGEDRIDSSGHRDWYCTRCTQSSTVGGHWNSMSENAGCEQSQGLDNPTLVVVGAVLFVAGVLPYLGVPVMSESLGSWSFAIGLAVAFRGYNGGCLSGLIPGVQQCNVEDAAEKQ